ncbi:MAG: sigma-70 family RNA polymerase sigma factor [Defluviitaleaceae bacterium]|nr:sigma-70 family RNA polymerase sigma factor [Defluviitaleaceae bacterium]
MINDEHARGELVRLIGIMQSGDKSAFNEIYRRCSGYVSFICAKLCDNKEDAEEVVQDTFLIAFKKSDQLRGETLPAYLRTIAVHECFNRRKANQKRRMHTLSADYALINVAELNEALLPADALDNKELHGQLLREIAKLPLQQRDMIYLFYYADFDAKQIGKIMGCNVNVVYTNLTRARQTIKKKLNDGRSMKPVVVSAQAGVLLPLAALFVAEEAAYVAAYVTSAWAGNIAVGATAAAAGAKTGAIVAVCAVAAAALAAFIYFNVYPTREAETPTPESAVYTGHEPPAYPLPEPHTEPPTEPAPKEPTQAEPAPPEPAPSPSEDPDSAASSAMSDPEYDTEYASIPSPTTVPALPPAPHYPADLPTEVLTEPETHAPHQPYAPSEPYDFYEYDEPPHADRTLQILAALAAVSTYSDLADIIDVYGFVLHTQATTVHDIRLRFYVANEGSGDILVGRWTIVDATDWHMRYEFFENGYMPQDGMALYEWMN